MSFETTTRKALDIFENEIWPIISVTHWDFDHTLGGHGVVSVDLHAEF